MEPKWSSELKRYLYFFALLKIYILAADSPSLQFNFWLSPPIEENSSGYRGTTDSKLTCEPGPSLPSFTVLLLMKLKPKDENGAPNSFVFSQSLGFCFFFPSNLWRPESSHELSDGRTERVSFVFTQIRGNVVQCWVLPSTSHQAMSIPVLKQAPASGTRECQCQGQLLVRTSFPSEKKKRKKLKP